MIAFTGIRIGGLTLLARNSGGGRTLASYHPSSSLTWHWALSIDRKAFGPKWGYYTIPCGHLAKQRHLRLGMWTVKFDTQSYHKENRK